MRTKKNRTETKSNKVINMYIVQTAKYIQTDRETLWEGERKSKILLT